MDIHTKKMIAPIVIASLFILYYIGFFVLCMFIPIAPLPKLLLGIVPLLLAGVCIYVLAERIKEIREAVKNFVSMGKNLF